jgi:hypothetical protein
MRLRWPGYHFNCKRKYVSGLSVLNRLTTPRTAKPKNAHTWLEPQTSPGIFQWGAK